MRTLFFGTPAFGHVVPELPLARALREQGHVVAFATAASMAGLVGSEGFELLQAGPEIPETIAEVERSAGVNLLKDGVTVETEAEFFAGARVDLGYEQCLAAALDWKPDLIVAEALDYVAPMVGAELGVPVATLAFGPAIPPENVEAAQARVKARHQRFGLDVPPSQWYLDTCPPSLQVDGWQAPDTRMALRPEAYTGGGAPTSVSGPDAAADSCDPDAGRARPRVLVSFGTMFVIPEIITPIARELLKQDTHVLITLGPNRTSEEFDLHSERVEFVEFTPLDRLLGDVDVVVTVGGAGTVLGALAHGVPLVMTPLGADQPLHAGRAQAAGAGIAFPLGECEPQRVAEAVSLVLRTPDYRQAARRVAAEISGMPSPAEVAAKLAAELGACLDR